MKISKGSHKKTKVIMPVHYAGNSCELDPILNFAKDNDIYVVEDAAQGVGATYKSKLLGTLGDLSAFSFHETKNITCGEGGALVVNNSKFTDRAEIIWEKGTNRKQFFRGQVDKYSWIDIGSSFLPSDITAAILWAQLQKIKEVTQNRLAIWDKYYEGFANLESKGILKRPVLNPNGQHNGHIFYLTFEDLETRNGILSHLRERKVEATFHYIPLHSSIAGRKFGRPAGELKNTDRISDTLMRLPIYFGFDHVDYVVDMIENYFESN
ncbi:MAG: DegT/DnrJ/EryC1/StrS family aminotransferase [Bdellovibrionales bacterium]